MLLVVFLVAVMALSVMATGPNVLTEGKREKEEDMIWRGKQYVRGVKLYYRKLGKFPTTIDDLTKPKIGSLRFMRQEYKDPMNKGDGTWRLIYVGPSGQLIGSLKPQQQNLALPGVGGVGGLGAPAAGILGATNINGASSMGNAMGNGQSTFGGSTFGGQQPPPAGTGTQPAGNPAGANPNDPNANPQAQGNDPMANPPNGGAGDTPTIIGGNIIGVGSKINRSSVIIYEKAKNYQLFEFIWDPSKDTGGGMGPTGMQTGAGLGQNIGGSSTMQPGGTGMSPAGPPTSDPNSGQPQPTPNPSNPQP